MLVRRLLLEKYLVVNRVAKTNCDCIIVNKKMGGKVGEPGRIGLCDRAIYVSVPRTGPRRATILSY